MKIFKKLFGKNEKVEKIKKVSKNSDASTNEDKLGTLIWSSIGIVTEGLNNGNEILGGISNEISNQYKLERI